ncbi:MAG: MATE family efflux transporter [Nocardioidaceae bacterium]|nr:MAG: MATE family efflux transporter [Nocardioidaceae bacterium]
MDATDREILRLAVPAFLTLVAEPLFLLSDAAIVGHLGTPELAGQGIAAAVLQTTIGLCVFLAYGTTASVARRLGAGDTRGALAQGIDGIWLAVGIGLVGTLLGVVFASPLVQIFGAGDDASSHAVIYLRISMLGMIPMLVVLATTGVLRGMQDTRTPLVVAVVGNAINIVLNVVLVYPAGMGLAGSALGTVLAQLACAAALLAVVLAGARRTGASLRPDVPGVLAAGRAGIPLLVRTLTLRAALLVTTFAVVMSGSGGSSRELAANQIAFAVWAFLAYALDAIAIAAQAIVGRNLGAGDISATRQVTARMVRWGWWSGAACGLALAACSPLLGPLFTSDADVGHLLVPVLLVAALGQPIAGVVFVLDGVLIGAGDGRFLAWGGLIVLAVYVPVLFASALAFGGLVTVWACFVTVFMGARFVVLTRRARTDKWLVTGVG